MRWASEWKGWEADAHDAGDRRASQWKGWKADAHDAGSGGPASGNVGKLMLMMLGQGQRVDTLGS